MLNASKEVKILTAITSAAGVAGATDLEGTALDMAGFESVLMVVRFGVITSGAVTSIKAQQSSDNAVADAYSDLEGTSQTVADDDDDEIFYIDLIKPTKRYVRLYVDRATQNAVIAEAHYVQYGAKLGPVTQPTGVNGEIHISPAEGTA